MKITITEEEITVFLDKIMDEKYPDLRMRVIEDNYSDPSVRFVDMLKASKYTFNGDTLEYFNIYVDILREKSLKLLNAIDILDGLKKGNLDKDSDVSILSELDIKIENECILYSDVLRLVNPIVENIFDLKKYVEMSNDVNTYLHFSVNKDRICLQGGNFYELFPSRKLQVTDIEFDGSIRGYVPLTENQKKKMYEQQEKNCRLVLAMLDDLK